MFRICVFQIVLDFTVGKKASNSSPIPRVSKENIIMFMNYTSSDFIHKEEV